MSAAIPLRTRARGRDSLPGREPASLGDSPLSRLRRIAQERRSRSSRHSDIPPTNCSAAESTLPASAGTRAKVSGWRGALACLALAALACATPPPAGAPPPVPRGGDAAADAWRALIALEGRELVLADAPPPAAASWCEPIAATPHYRCALDLSPILVWRGRVIRYAQEIDCLRGMGEACDAQPADARERCRGWLPLVCP